MNFIHFYAFNSFEHVKTTRKMLEKLDAEKFCIGHADSMTRADIEKHLGDLKQPVKLQSILFVSCFYWFI